MAELKSTLDEVLESWRDVREGVIDELANIPAGRMDFRPVPEVRSVREQVQHILEVSMMATGEFTRADTNLQRAPWHVCQGGVESEIKSPTAEVAEIADEGLREGVPRPG